MGDLPLFSHVIQFQVHCDKPRETEYDFAARLGPLDDYGSEYHFVARVEESREFTYDFMARFGILDQYTSEYHFVAAEVPLTGEVNLCAEIGAIEIVIDPDEILLDRNDFGGYVEVKRLSEAERQYKDRLILSDTHVAQRKNEKSLDVVSDCEITKRDKLKESDITDVVITTRKNEKLPDTQSQTVSERKDIFVSCTSASRLAHRIYDEKETGVVGKGYAHRPNVKDSELGHELIAHRPILKDTAIESSRVGNRKDEKRIFAESQLSGNRPNTKETSVRSYEIVERNKVHAMDVARIIHSVKSAIWTDVERFILLDRPSPDQETAATTFSLFDRLHTRDTERSGYYSVTRPRDRKETESEAGRTVGRGIDKDIEMQSRILAHRQEEYVVESETISLADRERRFLSSRSDIEQATRLNEREVTKDSHTLSDRVMEREVVNGERKELSRSMIHETTSDAAGYADRDKVLSSESEGVIRASKETVKDITVAEEGVLDRNKEKRTDVAEWRAIQRKDEHDIITEEVLQGEKAAKLTDVASVDIRERKNEHDIVVHGVSKIDRMKEKLPDITKGLGEAERKDEEEIVVYEYSDASRRNEKETTSHDASHAERKVKRELERTSVQLTERITPDRESEKDSSVHSTLKRKELETERSSAQLSERKTVIIETELHHFLQQTLKKDYKYTSVQDMLQADRPNEKDVTKEDLLQAERIKEKLVEVSDSALMDRLKEYVADNEGEVVVEDKEDKDEEEEERILWLVLGKPTWMHRWNETKFR